MIKLKEDFDISVQELLDMDIMITYILDFFELDSFEQLVIQREKLLEAYFLGSYSEEVFNKQKQYLDKYFDHGSLPQGLREIKQQTFEKFSKQRQQDGIHT